MLKNLSQANDNKSIFLSNNRRELDKLRTFIDFSEGFTIGFVEVDKLQEQTWILEELMNHFKDKNIYFYVLNFDDPNLQFLLDEIVKKLKKIQYQDHKKLVLILEGLERSIGLWDNAPPVLQDLNFVRDAFSYDVPHPILFCLPKYAITRLAKFAPDFWAWKSGIFTFESVSVAEQPQLNWDPFREYSPDLELPKSQNRVDLLEKLSLEYSQPKNEKDLVNFLNILQQLGVAYRSQGELVKAEETLKKALALMENGHFSPNTKANIFMELGNIYRDEKKYEQAEKAYQNALIVYHQENFPQHWGSLQNSLGIVYANKNKGDIANNLEKAITAFQNALTVYTFDAFPAYWAMIQNNLANTYRKRIKGDKAEHLEKAITTYTNALKVYTFDAFPQDWAMTQNHLANAYLERIRGDKAENLEKAIACLEKALKVFNFDLFPQDWAMTQNHLANAYLQRIRGDKAENLEKAIAAYSEALKVYTFDKFPQAWTIIEKNLFLAYSARISIISTTP